MTNGRPLWLVTLADLSLLLVGFFVLLQARADHPAIARALAARFSGEAAPVAVAAEAVHGFAPGSAALPPDARRLERWAAQQLADPRVALTVTGGVDGTPADVDPPTRSGDLLAADRARAVAAVLAPLAPERVRIATATGGRSVTVTLAFAGERTTP